MTFDPLSGIYLTDNKRDMAVIHRCSVFHGWPYYYL